MILSEVIKIFADVDRTKVTFLTPRIVSKFKKFRAEFAFKKALFLSDQF